MYGHHTVQIRNFWYVWVEGTENPVGPVTADQLARGIRAGKVPTDASVQKAGDVWWNGILDEPEVIEALKSVPDQHHREDVPAVPANRSWDHRRALR